MNVYVNIYEYGRAEFSAVARKFLTNSVISVIHFEFFLGSANEKFKAN